MTDSNNIIAFQGVLGAYRIWPARREARDGGYALPVV